MHSLKAMVFVFIFVGGVLVPQAVLYMMSYYYKTSDTVEKRNRYIHESFEDFPTSCVYKNVYEIYLTEGPLIEVTLNFFSHNFSDITYIHVNVSKEFHKMLLSVGYYKTYCRIITVNINKIYRCNISYSCT